MDIEQRVVWLERSANRYRRGCILLALALLLKISLAAEPLTAPEHSIIQCRGIIVNDEHDQSIAGILPTLDGTGVTLQLGGDASPFRVTLFSGQNEANFEMGKKDINRFSVQVQQKQNILIQSFLGMPEVSTTADKRGGYLYAADLTGRLLQVNSDGISRGRVPQTQP